MIESILTAAGSGLAREEFDLLAARVTSMLETCRPVETPVEAAESRCTAAGGC
jgi:hypothetical protein